MTKDQFQEQQKEQINSKYQELKAAKIKRPEALEILAKQYGYSTYTISELLSRKSYRKTKKREAS